MKTYHVYIILITYLLVSMPLTSNAASQIVDVNGQLIGATSVEVLGNLYDVDFLEGTADDIYTGENPFYPITESNHHAFSSALENQVFIDTSLGAFDSDPTKTISCASDFRCDVTTAFDYSDIVNIKIGNFLNYENDELDHIVPATTYFSLSRSLDISSHDRFVFAKWTTQASAVPEPQAESMLLLGFVLISLIFRQRLTTN